MRFKLTLTALLFCGFVINASAAEEQVSSTTIPLVYSLENTGASFAKPAKLTADQMESCEKLPDPFAWSDGSGRSEDFADWEKRRNEIKAEVEYYEIGEKPEVDLENVDANYIVTNEWKIDTTWTDTTYFTWNGQEYAWSVTHSHKAGEKEGYLEVIVKVGENQVKLTSSFNIPAGDKAWPIFIGMNSGTGSLSGSIFNGCLQVPFSHDQVATYGSDSKRYESDPFNVAYPDLYDNGNYSKWAWGVSRIIDGLYIVKEKGQLNLDLDHIALSGCSYAGKMAMFCGAYDERVALTIVQESGGGGASGWRTIAYTAKKFGISVEGIGNTNYSWFMTSMQKFSGKQDLLPHDHHEILAMCAPRALLVLGNTDMEWLCDYSTYITCRAVEKIYETFGIEDRFGFVIDGGHNHCSATDAENEAVAYFMNKFIYCDTTLQDTLYRTITDGSSYGLSNGRTVEYMDEDVYTYWFEDWKPGDPNRPTAKITNIGSKTYETVPESIKVIVDVTDINDDVENVTFYVNDKKVAVDSEAPYEYTLANLESGVYNVYGIATDATGLTKKSNTVTFTILTPVIAVPKVTTPPTIDGQIDDIWETSGATKLYAINKLVGDPDDENCSGYCQLLWDETYIYALCVVTDDQLVHNGGNVYDDDNVELYFDCNNSKGSSYDSDDVQYSFNYDSDVIATIPSNYATSNIDFVIDPTREGYIAEIRIAWESIKGTPEDGKNIGFDFMIDDDDDGDTRDNKRSWNATSDNAWQCSSSFGTVTLVNTVAIIDAAIDELEASIYPNPATNVLNVSVDASEFNFEVFDIAGKVQLSGKSEGTINVAKLAKGLYTVRISTADKTRNLKFQKQ